MEQLMRGLAAESDNEEIPSEDEDVAQDVEDRPHARLLDAISSMDGNKRLKHTLRTIHGQNVSEFGFKTQKVDAQTLMSEMMGSLHKSASHSALKKQLKSAYTSAQVVDTPAPKHIKEKIQRSVGYEKTVKEISKWEPVVTANKRAEQLKFPLEQPTQKLLNTHITFRPITTLEKEIQAELAKVKPENRIPKGKLFTPKEEEEMKAMSLEEARERRAELMRMRAIMYTKASKLRWQNKIKSKRYRRAKKKEKLKQMEKELEELAVTDPQALMDRMEEVERKRLEERGRLRHMGGGKFARQAKVFSKYDNEKRQQIQDMLAKHKELLKKQQVPSSSDSEEEVDTFNVSSGTVHSKNAWMQPTAPRLISTAGPQKEARVDEDDDDDEEMDEEEEKERKFLASFDVEESDEEEAEDDSDNDGKGEDAEKAEDSEEMAADLSHSMPQTEAPATQENEIQETEDTENKKTDKKDDTQKESSHNNETQGITRVLRKKAGKKGNRQMETTLEKETQQRQRPDAKTSKKKEKKQMEVTHEEKPHEMEETEIKTTDKKRKKKQKEKPVSENPASREELEKNQTQYTEEYEVVKSQKKKKRAKKQKDTQAQETAQSSQETSEANEMVLSDKEEKAPTKMQDHNAAVFTTAKTKKSKKRSKRKNNSDTQGETAEEKALMAVVKGLRTTDESDGNTESKKDKKSKNNPKPGDANKFTDSKPETSADTLMTIAEAFDDDDVVAEFVEEKRRVAEEEEEKDKDLFVPGWGSWAGAGIVHSKKMRERFIKKAPPHTRTDNQIGHVIISEKKNTAVEKHMLDKVPFPYKDLTQMQTILSKPIGRDFTSEAQFKKNIKPKTVVNRIGQIIQPINESALLHGGQKRKAVDIELNTKKPEKTVMRKKKRKN